MNTAVFQQDGVRPTPHPHWSNLRQYFPGDHLISPMIDNPWLPYSPDIIPRLLALGLLEGENLP